MSEGFQAKNRKVYIKLAVIQGKNLKLKGEKLKTQAKNSKLKDKTQGFGKTKNAVCLKLGEGHTCSDG